jgi:hypothetical protein
MSEVAFQRSLLTASALKQATADVQTQASRDILRPCPELAAMNYFTPPCSLRTMADRSTGLTLSIGPTSIMSPNVKRKRIRFYEQAEQCIAVVVEGDDDRKKKSTNNPIKTATQTLEPWRSRHRSRSEYSWQGSGLSSRPSHLREIPLRCYLPQPSSIESERLILKIVP